VQFCPICKTESSFQPAGISQRQHARCPRCGSLERHRALFLYLFESTNIFRDNLAVLHVSPERGLSDALRKQKNLHYQSSSFEEGEDLRLDLTKIDLPDASFDVIICSHVLEHIPDDRSALREIYRVLRPGGWAILIVPLSKSGETDEDSSVTSAEDRLKRFGQQDHVRVYGGKDFLKRIREVGFEVSVVNLVKDRTPDYARRYGILTSDILHFVRKPLGAGRTEPAFEKRPK